MNKNNIWFFAIAILVLAGLFFLLKPRTAPAILPTPANQPSVSPTAEVTQPNTFELVIQGKKLVSGPETIKVTQGEDVTIKITSDEAEEFHVHAYDNSVELEPNKQASLTFTANLSGRFPFELENSKTEIGALEVQPK